MGIFCPSFHLCNKAVSSYQTGGSDGSGLPVESLSLNFTNMTQEYFTQDEKGATKSAGKAGWDVKANKKL